MYSFITIFLHQTTQLESLFGATALVRLLIDRKHWRKCEVSRVLFHPDSYYSFSIIFLYQTTQLESLFGATALVRLLIDRKHWHMKYECEFLHVNE